MIPAPVEVGKNIKIVAELNKKDSINEAKRSHQ